jgi:iron complex transport system substrate-binding protein
VRVASFLSGATEMVHFCGAGEALVPLVRVTHECDYPAGVENLPHLTSTRIEGGDMTSSSAASRA